jgi:two-component system sensor histidine kinase KdpD
MDLRAGLVPLRLAASLGAVAGLTALYSGPLPANPTTVALSYVVLVLLIATEWGLIPSTVAALAAALAFNVFFLPPFGTLVIADPRNWISFGALLATAIIVSQLSSRARERRLDALSRQRDLERLYALSRGMLLSDDGVPAPTGIARHIAGAFDVQGVALYDHHSGMVGHAGATEIADVEHQLRDVARQAVTLRPRDGLVVTAIRLGGAPVGALALAGDPLSDTVLQSIANLAAIGLERARGRDAALTLEASRRSSELRSALLDSLAHEFKTPLTSIRVAVGALASAADQPPDHRELVAIIDEESSRLQSLVSDAIQMFRLDAGDVVPQREAVRLRDLADQAIAEVRPRAAGRAVSNTIGPEIVVHADDLLVGLALRQLLDNALKYSSPGTPIEVLAAAGDTIDVAVRNHGTGIPSDEHGRIFDRFYRGSGSDRVPGTGMGLAIVRQIARAHGGGVGVRSDGQVTEVHLTLPAAVTVP